jgi:hypothetical protein
MKKILRPPVVMLFNHAFQKFKAPTTVPMAEAIMSIMPEDGRVAS